MGVWLKDAYQPTRALLTSNMMSRGLLCERMPRCHLARFNGAERLLCFTWTAAVGVSSAQVSTEELERSS